MEGVNLGVDVSPARLGTFKAQTELVVFFITDQNVGKTGDFAKYIPKLLFASFPERRAVVQIKADAGTVLLGRPGKIQAKLAGFW